MQFEKGNKIPNSKLETVSNAMEDATEKNFLAALCADKPDAGVCAFPVPEKWKTHTVIVSFKCCPEEEVQRKLVLKKGIRNFASITCPVFDEVDECDFEQE